MNNVNPIYCRREDLAFHECTREHLQLDKLLWKGRRPEDGLKELEERPAMDSWSYQMHVWFNKNNYN